jgi:hypothetical protein
MSERNVDVPVAGTLSGDVHWESSDECLPHQPVRTLWNVEGDLAPLGRTRGAGRHCAYARGGGFGGRAVFTGADGDALCATYTFTLLSETPALLTMEMTGRFVDRGTGRFAHASGAWRALVHAHTVVVPPTIDTHWPVDFTFDGQVTYSPVGEPALRAPE